MRKRTTSAARSFLQPARIRGRWNALSSTRWQCGFAARYLRPRRFVCHRLRRSRSTLDCLLVELNPVEILHPSSKAQLFSCVKLLDIPIGLLINFHEPVLKHGISRMILPGRESDGRMQRQRRDFVVTSPPQTLCFLCSLAKAFGVAFCKLCAARSLQPFNALTLQPCSASPAPRVSSSSTAIARS